VEVTVQRRHGQAAKVWCTVTTTDDRGNSVETVDPASPHEVRAAFVSPSHKDGARLVTMLVTAPLADLTAWSRVEWGGTTWDLRGAPVERGSGRLRHVVLELVERVHVGEREAGS
jgi:hypothetical protein